MLNIVEIMYYLDSIHQWIVAILQELQTKFFEKNADAKCRLSCHFFICDGLSVACLLSWPLVVIKRHVVCFTQDTVVDHVIVADGLDIGHCKCPTEARVPVNLNETCNTLSPG